MESIKNSIQLMCLALLVLVTACSPKFSEEAKTDFNLVKNEGGSTLGYNPNSGIKLLTLDQYAFKDLNKNGTLDAYEDWRLSADERVKKYRE
ncbi:hypothetical protein [Maribacter arenosus]|uniref:Beta-glucosidase n=1 Tax=Maribacter arenosus TaxID=1854708 RepID=A0ABR7VH10_9FLAO|nr:hypothetical protein [Maribacter arenosus]MBD0851817.1 hypothetical protein [Maribacter arenosus]